MDSRNPRQADMCQHAEIDTIVVMGLQLLGDTMLLCFHSRVIMQLGISNMYIIIA